MHILELPSWSPALSRLPLRNAIFHRVLSPWFTVPVTQRARQRSFRMLSNTGGKRIKVSDADFTLFGKELHNGAKLDAEHDVVTK